MMGCNHDYSWWRLTTAIGELTNTLIAVVENTQGTTRGIRKSKQPIEPQMLLFPVDNETREKFDDTANLFEHYLVKHERKGFDFFHHRLSGYELYAFIRRWSDAEWEPQIVKMKMIARGELPSTEECLNLLEFLNRVESYAVGEARDPGRHGGCFA